MIEGVRTKLTSPVFAHNGSIPPKYTCQGENVSPPLAIADVPEGAKSLALIMEDPDVPHSIRADGMWDHWLVWNIDPATRQIKEGSEPEGVHGLTTSKSQTYGGPCPPDREHRYFFKLHALDTTLDLPQGSTKEQLLAAMNGHIVEQAELIGRYEKS